MTCCGDELILCIWCRDCECHESHMVVWQLPVKN